MSYLSQTTNGTVDSASKGHLNYPLASYIDSKTCLPSTQTSTPGTSTTKHTAMGDTTPTLSPISSIPCNPVTSAKTNMLSPPLDEASETLNKIKFGTTDGAVSALRHTSETASSSENQAAKPPNKRGLEQHAAEEEGQPKRGKFAADPNVKASGSATVETKVLEKSILATGDPAMVDEGASSPDEPVESKKPVKKLEPKSKPTPKKAAAASRRGPPACSECKRRKVKCKHRPVEETPLLGADAMTHDAATAEGKPHKPREVDKAETSERVDGAHNDAVPGAEKASKRSGPKKQLASKPPRAPPERTSTRIRKVPERLEDLQEMPPSQAEPPRKSTSKVFDPYYITTNSTSRLGRADIYHLLLEDGAWTSLTAEQKITLISMLPDGSENQQLLEQIKAGVTGNETRPQWFKASNVFGDEVAKFRSDLTNGHLGKTWQAAAEQAVAERAAGEYDAWKAVEAELWWGQKSK